MKLLEVFNQLTYGELSQISIGGGNVGEIAQRNYPAILSHMNLGLTQLYKRFSLKQGELRIATVTGLTTYLLSSKYAVSNTRSREPIKYILDSPLAPYTDDLLKVEEVWYAGEELSINNARDSFTVHMPSEKVIRLPTACVGYVDVKYRANHPHLDVDTMTQDPEDLDIELPYSHLQALLLFIASRVNTPMGMSNEHHAGNSYYAKFEAECARLEAENVHVDKVVQRDHFREKGWV